MSLIAIVCCSAPVWADYAVVVGVGEYENLPPTAKPLEGPPNDVREIKAALEKMDFKVVSLVDKQATKEGILKALKDAKDPSLWKTPGRFVFYFAGHGTNVPKAILPYDTKWGGLREENRSVIRRDELHSAVEAIPAGVRTVILDSCFSAAMRADDPDLVPRYISLDLNDRSGVTKRDDDPNEKDSMPEFQATSPRPIRLIAAAQDNQKAYEKTYLLPNNKTEKRGVFSRNLLPRLKKELETTTPGEVIVAQVTGEVKEQAHNLQVPLPHNLNPGEPLLGVAVAVKPIEPDGTEGNPTRSGPGKPAVTFKDVSLWEMFLVERTDSKFATITLTPNKTLFTVYPVGEKVPPEQCVTISIEAKKAGWVLVLARDAQGIMRVAFPNPEEFSLGAAYLAAEDDRSLLVDCPLGALGGQSFKVIHISEEAKARELFSKFAPLAKKGTFPDGDLKDLRMTYYADLRLFTRLLTIQGITPEEAAKIAAEKKKVDETKKDGAPL